LEPNDVDCVLLLGADYPFRYGVFSQESS